MSQRIACILFGILFSTSAIAQIPAANQFEVASIRPTAPYDRNVTIQVGPGPRFTAHGYTLQLLIQRAYGVMGWNISGGPAWIDTDRFDVSAKAGVPGNLTEEQLRPMLQAMLAHRFHLMLHQGSKEVSGLALVVARDGPRMKMASGPGDSDSFRLNQSGIKAQGIAMDDFARYVGGKLGVVASNETGLKGFYDIDVPWTIDMEQSTDLREALRPMVFDALPKHLGLRLTAKKVSVRMLQIDGAEKPSEN
ncbi:MAG: TIGR03435 family protein [Bryobacteraceae bacterium]